MYIHIYTYIYIYNVYIILQNSQENIYVVISYSIKFQPGGVQLY